MLKVHASPTTTSPPLRWRMAKMQFERNYRKNDRELKLFQMFAHYGIAIPQIFAADCNTRTILMEDLSSNCVQCSFFDENNELGDFVRENFDAMVCAAADMHAIFWENGEAFGQIGIDRRHESEKKLLAHIDAIENDFLRYAEEERSGNIPKKWEIFENNIDLNKLDYFPQAIKLLREKYPELLEKRFHTGKNVTVIHGDMHPGNCFVSKTDCGAKLIDLQAVRMGLCIEDLAMLLALHIAPNKQQAQPLLDRYYSRLCKKVIGYSCENFMNDYKIAIMENMFFPIKLMIRHKIFDFAMRARAAIAAFEAFVLNI